jgi:alpha-L-fucosidase 2
MSCTWNRSSGFFRAELVADRRINTKLHIPEWVDGCEMISRSACLCELDDNGIYELEIEVGGELTLERKMFGINNE